MSAFIPAPPKEGVTLAKLRAEKQRHVAAFNQQKRLQQLALADYIEAHPDSLEIARQHVQRYLASPAHARIHWILARWQQKLSADTAGSIASVFRDESPETQGLRECPPYFGPIDT